jgi:putative GTP pyrophosphokinase
MRIFSKTQSDFLAEYGRDAVGHSRAAERARSLIGDVLSGKGVLFHTIEARAKEPLSLRRKIFTKQYSDPKQQITDIIGVRVIVFYDTEIKAVKDTLAAELKIHGDLSVDKKTDLGFREFGYRSLHLIVSLKGFRTRAAEFRDLTGRRFEIQIRTVLEHAWAEIEHEVVYKSGIKYAPTTRRRFASLAGALEILGREFLALRAEKQELIGLQKASLEKRITPKAPLDVINLSAFLEIQRPHGQRFSNTDGVPTGIESLCVDALRRSGIKTLGQFRRFLKSTKLNRQIQRYASNSGYDAASVGDFSVIILLLMLKNVQVVRELFPDFLADTGVLRVSENLARTKARRKTG